MRFTSIAEADAAHQSLLEQGLIEDLGDGQFQVTDKGRAVLGQMLKDERQAAKTRALPRSIQVSEIRGLPRQPTIERTET